MVPAILGLSTKQRLRTTRNAVVLQTIKVTDVACRIRKLKCQSAGHIYRRTGVENQFWSGNYDPVKVVLVALRRGGVRAG